VKKDTLFNRMIEKSELQHKLARLFEVMDKIADKVQEDDKIYASVGYQEMDDYWGLSQELGEFIISSPELVFSCINLLKKIGENAPSESFASTLESNESYQKITDIISELVLI